MFTTMFAIVLATTFAATLPAVLAPPRFGIIQYCLFQSPWF